MGCCHLCRPELALRNPRIAEECLDPWLHDRGHGPYVSLTCSYEHTFADFLNSHVDCCCIPSSLHASCRGTWHGKWYRGTRRCRCLHSLIFLFVNDTSTCIPLSTFPQMFCQRMVCYCDLGIFDVFGSRFVTFVNSRT